MGILFDFLAAKLTLDDFYLPQSPIVKDGVGLGGGAGMIRHPERIPRKLTSSEVCMQTRRCGPRRAHQCPAGTAIKRG